MESEKSKNKKKAQRKIKKPIVVKVKRKRDETPEQALVIEQRITKKTKVNFLDSFKNMTLTEKSPEDQTFASMLLFRISFCYWIPETYFRYFGTGNNNFDVNAKLKEAHSPQLPHVYTIQQVWFRLFIHSHSKIQAKQNNNNNMTNNNSNTIAGQVTNKVNNENYDIIELDHNVCSFFTMLCSFYLLLDDLREWHHKVWFIKILSWWE